MAQAPHAEATVGIVLARQTEQPSGGDLEPTGGFGSPTTLLLLLVGGGFLWWNMRRRRMFEERLREQRRQESITHAEQSAQNVALIMRGSATPEAAAAAAAEGLASAARTPAPDRSPERRRDAASDTAAATNGTETAAHGEAHARMLDRAEAAAAAEQAAEEEARLAARAAGQAATEKGHRLAAQEAAAEARADTIEAVHAPVDREARDREAQAALRAGLRDLEHDVEPPLGAIAGDGTAICPPDFPVKGVAAAHRYHGPGSRNYPMVVADFCLASAEAAEAAGFQRAAASEERSQD